MRSGGTGRKKAARFQMTPKLIETFKQVSYRQFRHQILSRKLSLVSSPRASPLTLHPCPLALLVQDVVARVSCGDAHAAAILSTGALYAWGQNESGQVGCGTGTSTGKLENKFSPQLIEPFKGRDVGSGGGVGADGVEEGVGKASDGGMGLDRRVTFVACGPSHTVAIDNEKNVWSWGAQVNNTVTQNEFHKLCLEIAHRFLYIAKLLFNL